MLRRVDPGIIGLDIAGVPGCVVGGFRPVLLRMVRRNCLPSWLNLKFDLYIYLVSRSHILGLLGLTVSR